MKNNNNMKKQQKKVKETKVVLPRPEFGFQVHVKAGYPALRAKGGPVVKFFDNSLFNATIGTIPTVQGLYAPAQGAQVTQRVGDVAFLHKMYLTYTCNAANTDVFSALRVILFQWRPNNGLIAPVATDILQITADGIYAMYDWNFSDQYRILYDKLHTFAGTATNPATSCNQCVSQSISLASAFKKVNFSIGAVTCSNSIYFLAVSDSLVLPFPNLLLKSRITFEEE